MKKLNKAQKQTLNNYLIKGINIICYVIAGLSITLGVVAGIKSCSDKKKQAFATTPVVSEVLSRKDLIALPNTSTGVIQAQAKVDYMRYIDSTTYFIDGRSYNDWTTWGSLAGQTLIEYTYPNGVDANTSGYIANPIHIKQWSRANGWYSDYYCYKLTFGSNNQLRSYTRGSSGYSTIDPTMMANGNQGYYELYLSFETPSCDVNINILPNQNGQNKPEVFYNFLTSHISAEVNDHDNWLEYNYENDGVKYAMGQYITPYGVYGHFDAIGSRANPSVYCVFDGLFTLGTDSYTGVYVETEIKEVNTIVFGAPAYERVMTDIVYYNRFNGNSLVVAKSNHATLPGVMVNMVDYWNNNVRWSWLNYNYQNVMIKQINSGYAVAFDYNDNNGDAYWGLTQTFSGDYNQYTMAPGTLDNSNSGIPNYTGDDQGQIAWNSVFGLLGQAFTSMASVFNYYILPGVSIGTLLFLPLVVSIVVFIIWLIKR